jgi:hypothetical protein
MEVFPEISESSVDNQSEENKRKDRTNKRVSRIKGEGSDFLAFNTSAAAIMVATTDSVESKTDPQK